MRVIAFAIVFFSVAAFGDQTGDRARLMGAWQLDKSGTDLKDAASVWSFEGKGDAVHITASDGDRKITDLECNTIGKECEVKESGRAVKVSMWFNGPKLVELETQGDQIVERRFQVTGQGDTLEIEVLPLSPSGKTEVLRLKRLQVAASHP